MITIEKPFIVEEGDFTNLKAKVKISDDTVKAYIGLKQKLPKTHWRTNEDYPPKSWENDNAFLYFSVPKEYGKYFCEDRSDAFVVAMLWYAFMTGSDIQFEAPISEKMFFNITQLLIPALCKKYKKIKLTGSTINSPVPTCNAVGTGMSCGVDSLYSLKKYTAPSVPESYRLTHLAYFNMGAVFHPNTATNKHYAIDEFYKETDRMSIEKLENARQVATLSNLSLLYVYSNVDEDFYRGAYGYTGVYRNCASCLSLQKLFDKYYCSSAGWPEFFDLSLSEGSEHYETLLCDAFSTESLQFIISDYDTRLEKTEALSDYEIAHKYLDVCFNFNNCGTCSKCYRTLITLDILGKIDSFKQVFDVGKYKKNRDLAFAWLIETKNGDAKDDNVVFAKDIYDFAKWRNVAIPVKSYWLYKKKIVKNYCHTCFKRMKKFVKRILRGNKNQTAG